MSCLSPTNPYHNWLIQHAYLPTELFPATGMQTNSSCTCTMTITYLDMLVSLRLALLHALHRQRNIYSQVATICYVITSNYRITQRFKIQYVSQ